MGSLICTTEGCGTVIPTGGMVCPTCAEIVIAPQPVAFPYVEAEAGSTASPSPQFEPAPPGHVGAAAEAPVDTGAGGSQQAWTEGHNPHPAMCHVCGSQVVGAVCLICGTPKSGEMWKPQAGSRSAGTPTSSQRTLVLPGDVRLAIADGDTVILGRESETAVVAQTLCSFDTVSRRHTSIVVSGGSLEILDLGSVNGTFVDDRQLGSAPVVRTAPIRIGLGRSVTVEVQ